MELRTIGYFVAVADAGSVSAATQITHVTQPSLSRQLRQLEKELGLELFTRRDGRLVLAPAGRQFLPAARELLVRAEATRAAAAQIRAGGLPTLTVAAPPVTLNDVVAPFFATWGAEDPMPRVQALNAADEYGDLDRGADLVIGTRPPPETLAGMRVAALPVSAYVRPDHPLAGRVEVLLDELLAHELLVPTPDSHARRAFDAAAERAGLPVRLAEFSTSHVAQAVAAAGRGVAVVSDDPRYGLRQLAIRTSAGEALQIVLHAAWQPHHHGARQIAAVAGRLRRFVRERYTPA
ncbi:LysR family transcriptional regulator [Micropruina sp.]|uniref:LysR family transcriptional regulator n=1 Tax=Micropruina sp. TaxID=2737536 RepID=UPI002632B235|nr:LysR family transcriptional regulator [Micropruina sp.]